MGQLAAKAAGTVVACSILLLLYWENSRLGFRFTSCVAALQLVLQLYLACA